MSLQAPRTQLVPPRAPSVALAKRTSLGYCVPVVHLLCTVTVALAASNITAISAVMSKTATGLPAITVACVLQAVQPSDHNLRRQKVAHQDGEGATLLMLLAAEPQLTPAMMQ